MSTITRELAEDVVDRLGFLREDFAKALVIGDRTGALIRHLEETGGDVTAADPAPLPGKVQIDEEKPISGGPYDLIVTFGLLDTVNDLPGALVLMRHALKQGGLMIASFAAAGSLLKLRAAMLAGDGERPAPRIHPQVDVRAAGQLLTRTGFADPVVDGWGFDVGFDSFDQIIGDLRAQAMGNVLANPGPALTRSGLDVARSAFEAQRDDDGIIRERFEFVTLTGRNPKPRF
ncbi:methyltransferase domain-containing protein [Croceicoccus mobilis]|uniref:methyltransferase domain-containing protein n=1 Tax=Croceicoccus mobilis TaxID=1703339 RepID=UPI001FD0D0FD|nr:methyltransferase domain-containing protein [Croceicoccus mobilis]